MIEPGPIGDLHSGLRIAISSVQETRVALSLQVRLRDVENHFIGRVRVRQPNAELFIDSNNARISVIDYRWRRSST